MPVTKRFDELQPGDYVIGSDGKPVPVTAVYDQHIPEVMWEIETEDGEIIQASGNHLWYCETRLDWELLGSRKREGKKLLKHLTPQALDLLEETATKEEIVETRLIDMIVLVQASEKPELARAITRIAEAIGHVAENTTKYEDMAFGEEESETIRTYDARLFAQQILVLTGKRKYRKRWKLIVGSIMTTDDMIELGDSVEIPFVQNRGPSLSA